MGTQRYERNTQGTNEMNTQGTKERMGGRPQTQENKLKMTQTKTLELRIEFLVDAISKCHMAVATRKRWKEIEDGMDAVEIAWDRVKHTSWEVVRHAGLNLDHLPMMVEMVLTKAEKYLGQGSGQDGEVVGSTGAGLGSRKGVGAAQGV